MTTRGATAATPASHSNQSNNNISASSREALEHLRRLKPLDGWAVEVHQQSKETRTASAVGVQLLRRNVPLTNTFFFDLHYDPTSRCVVGILTSPSTTTLTTTTAQAQVLVDAKGSPTNSRQVQLVTVTTWNPRQMKQHQQQRQAMPTTATSRNARTAAASTAAASAATTSTTSATFPSSWNHTSRVATDEENMQLLKHAGMIVGGVIVARLLLGALFVVLVVALPFLYLYAVQTCPSEDSFDAKKELKRVLRGHHLPADHPEKPKGFLHETLARFTASVVAELSTGLGYEVSMTNLAPAANIVSGNVTSAKMNCYWIGAFGHWRYLMSREIESNKND